jgi:hypothetical protein
MLEVSEQRLCSADMFAGGRVEGRHPARVRQQARLERRIEFSAGLLERLLFTPDLLRSPMHSVSRTLKIASGAFRRLVQRKEADFSKDSTGDPPSLPVSLLSLFSLITPTVSGW